MPHGMPSLHLTTHRHYQLLLPHCAQLNHNDTNKDFSTTALQSHRLQQLPPETLLRALRLQPRQRAQPSRGHSHPPSLVSPPARGSVVIASAVPRLYPTGSVCIAREGRTRQTGLGGEPREHMLKVDRDPQPTTEPQPTTAQLHRQRDPEHLHVQRPARRDNMARTTSMATTTTTTRTR